MAVPIFEIESGENVIVKKILISKSQGAIRRLRAESREQAMDISETSAVQITELLRAAENVLLEFGK